MAKSPDSSVRLRRPSCLVVEDDPLMARAVERTLRRMRMEVRVVHTRRDALQTTHGALCGVFDVDLPDGDGVALARDLLDRGLVEVAVFFTGTCDRHLLGAAEELGVVVSKLDGPSGLRAGVAQAVLGTDDAPARQA